MKKLLGIVVLGLLLQGCASPGGVFGGGNPQPKIPSQIKDIRISWHFNSPPKNEIIQITNNHCKQVKQDLISDNLRLIYKANGMSIVNSEWDEWFFDCKKDENFVNTNTIVSKDINFTIKDKKEQCTAIGFAPATEKFADCVLRLVELDVKSQQAAQIALAQSQGNQQVAEQLKKQNNSRSSDAFIDLGLKLLSPQSTVSAPTTSTCRVIGSGAFKTVNCW